MNLGLVITFGIAWSVVCAVAASNRHRSALGWAVAGFCFGLFAYLALRWMPRVQPASAAYPYAAQFPYQHPPQSPQGTMIGMGTFPG